MSVAFCRIGTPHLPKTGRRATHLVKLVVRNKFSKFRTSASRELDLVPVCKNRGNRRIHVGFAFLVECVSAKSDIADSDPAEHYQHEKDYPKGRKKLLHGGRVFGVESAPVQSEALRAANQLRSLPLS